MKHFRLVMLAMFALLAIGAVSATTAMAEVAGPPAILVLEGKVTELTFTGSEATQKTALTVLSGKEITGEGLSAKLSGCTEIKTAESPKDSNACGEGLLTFSKTKQGTVNCRSENPEGTKDPVETILVKVSTKLATEKSTAGALEPLLILTVLGVDGKELLINCSNVKEKVKGQIGCLVLPGLKEIATTENVEVLCKTKSVGDQETGTCEEAKALCEELAKNPLEASLDGKTSEMAAQTAHLNLKANKNIFLDD